MLPAKPLSEMTEDELLHELGELRQRRQIAKQSAAVKRSPGTSKKSVAADVTAVDGDLSNALADLFGSGTNEPVEKKKRGRPAKTANPTPEQDAATSAFLQAMFEQQMREIDALKNGQTE